MTAPTMPVELFLWAVGQSASTLTVAYRVANHQPASIYLFNQIHRGQQPDGAFLVDPDLVYIELSQGAVHLAKWIPPIPEDIAVEDPIIPLATLLRSGETFEEAVTLTLPVASHEPYRPRRGPRGGFAPVTYDGFDLMLGYLPVSEMGTRSPHRVRTTRGDSIRVGALASAQTVLRSATVTMPVPVFPDRLPPPPASRCPNCGATNIGHQVACLRCSAPLRAVQRQATPPPAAPRERHCTACGAVISPTARFCGRCGRAQ